MVYPGRVAGQDFISVDKNGLPIVIYIQNYRFTFAKYNGQNWFTKHLTGASVNHQAVRAIKDEEYIYLICNGTTSTLSRTAVYACNLEGDIIYTSDFITGTKYTGNLIVKENEILYTIVYNGLKIFRIDKSDGSLLGNVLVDENLDLKNPSSILHNNKLYISYQDSYGKNLKLAEYDFINDTKRQWFITTEGDIGEFSSVFIDKSELIRIVYYDATNQELKQAKINPRQL